MTGTANICLSGLHFVYLLSQAHMSSCTLLLCQSGSGSRHSLRTRTARRHWPDGHSTIGCYSPDKGPDPGAAHSGGPEAQPLNIDVKKCLAKRWQCLKICHLLWLVTFFCYWVNFQHSLCALEGHAICSNLFYHL